MTEQEYQGYKALKTLLICFAEICEDIGINHCNAGNRVEGQKYFACALEFTRTAYSHIEIEVEATGSNSNSDSSE